MLHYLRTFDIFLFVFHLWAVEMSYHDLGSCVRDQFHRT